MFAENFVYFFTVQGFFVGIVFGVLKSFDAEGLFLYTFFITTFFYLFSHIVVALYFKTITVKAHYFPKETHEKDLDYFIKEINKREKIVDAATQMTDMMIKMNYEESLEKSK